MENWQTERYSSESFHWKGGPESKIRASDLIDAAKRGVTSYALAARLGVDQIYLRTCARSIGVRLADMPKTVGLRVQNRRAPPPDSPAHTPPPNHPPPSKALLALAKFDKAALRALKRRLGEPILEEDRDSRG